MNFSLNPFINIYNIRAKAKCTIVCGSKIFLNQYIIYNRCFTESLSLYSCPDCPSCPTNFNSIGWATWAILASVQKCSLTSPSFGTYLKPVSIKSVAVSDMFWYLHKCFYVDISALNCWCSGFFGTKIFLYSMETYNLDIFYGKAFVTLLKMSYFQVITTCSPPVLMMWQFDYHPNVSDIFISALK